MKLASEMANIFPLFWKRFQRKICAATDATSGAANKHFKDQVLVCYTCYRTRLSDNITLNIYILQRTKNKRKASTGRNKQRTNDDFTGSLNIEQNVPMSDRQERSTVNATNECLLHKEVFC